MARTSLARETMTDFSDLSQPSLPLVGAFMSRLELIRSSLPREEWAKLVASNLSIRRWRFFLSTDPYTRWGLLKPKGYPGDATLMDLAYGHDSIGEVIAAAGPVGRGIYEHTSSAKQSESARLRIRLLSERLTGLSETSTCDVISFASGHARELESLSVGTRRNISCFTAIDLDSESIKQAQISAGGIAFVPILRNAINGDLSDLEPARFVYSLGLFDYLKDEFARQVLERMWALVKPGGQLVVANLAPDAANLGYCEAIMDWWMISRSSHQMLELSKHIKKCAASEKKVSVTRHGCFNYLEIVKC